MIGRQTLVVGLHWLFKLATAAYFVYLAWWIFRLHPVTQASLDSILATSYVIFGVILLGRPLAREVRFDRQALVLSGASILYYYLLDFQQPVNLLGASVGNLLLTVGALVWIASAAYISDSFGILPALRKVRVRGPYSWVRHPMYTSYLLMDLGVLFYFPSLRNLLVAVLAAGLYAARARLEEQLLKGDPVYAAYKARTRFRFVPFLI